MTTLVFALVIALSLVLAWASRRGHAHPSLREYFTASRQFGAVLVFFLSVGETYSIGGLLGFPGGVYARGLPFAVWFVGYLVLSVPVGYLVNPLIWRAAKRLDALTLADLYGGHTRSRGLEILVALCAIGFLIPWGAMQFAGLNVALSGLGLHLPRAGLMGGAGVLAFAYLALSGVRAPAYVSVLKDALLIGAIALVAGAVLMAGFPPGSLARAWPAIPPDGPLLTLHQERYAITTTIFQALGLYMSPLTMAYIFTARSARAIRRAQIPMPLYMAMFPALTLVALAARASAVPVGSPNDAFIASARTLLSPGLLGLVAGAAALAGLVVLAGTCLAIGPLISRNLLPHLPETKQKAYAQGAMVGYLVLSMAAALALPGLIVTLNNLTYLGITQFLPGAIVIGLARPVSPVRLALGLIVGDAVGVSLFLGGFDCAGINAGLIGLVLNAAIVATGLRRTA
jgi:solute:Na+ symporter, SSS family